MFTKFTVATIFSLAAVAAIFAGEVRAQDPYDYEEKAVEAAFRSWQTSIDYGTKSDLTLRALHCYETAYWAWEYEYYELWQYALQKSKATLKYARKTKQPKRVIANCSNTVFWCQQAYDYYSSGSLAADLSL